MKKYLKIILIPSIFCMGCSSTSPTVFDGSFTSPAADAKGPNAPETEVTNVTIKPLEGKDKEEAKTDIQITWKAPNTPVDGFIIRYGDNKENLSQSKKVLIPALDLVKDPEKGELYRYRLKSPPQEDPLYIRIASFVGEVVSEDSALIEVKR